MCDNVRTKRLGLLMATLAMLTSGCAATVPSGTDAACDALRPHLPSYSTRDTDQTKQEGAQFLDVFQAVCG